MTTLNIPVDDALAKQAETIFDDIGMSLSTATTVFLKQAVRFNGIPFEVRLDPFYSKETEYLMSIPGLKEDLIAGMQEPIESCVEIDEI
jgi:DNA-damage-inducible protein J